MAVDAMELIYNPCIDALTLMTRDLIVIGRTRGSAPLCKSQRTYVITEKIVEKKEEVR